MVIELVTAGAILLALSGEALHRWRCKRLARLAFGPSARPAHWVRLAPVLRATGFGALTWGLLTLIDVEPRVHRDDSLVDDDPRHLLLLLDVSPSMTLKGADPTHVQTRQRHG